MKHDGEVKSAEKQHHKQQAGRKADKKKAKNKHEQEQTAQQRNPKAFAFHSVNKVARSVRRTLDIHEKRHHVPVVDRTPIEPPPVIVAVVGPPKVGKSTIIQCLIKSFTRTKLSNIRGPVTIVSGKKRRLSIIECNNDINSMIDIAKVADLVLLLVDASFGFEMEIFEFLNICQVHGFPKIMGVLTHLDHFKDNKALRKTKKRLKHRFWTEVYQGAKLFYLSGMVNGEYQKTEIHNLGRFISVMKFRPLQWRTTHPYLLTDRIEDVTDPEALRLDRKTDRSVCLYGYVRGTHFKNNSNVHLPGCGDFLIHDMNLLHDPCPLPDRDGKRRRLNEQERSIYAPFSGVGGIVYDKDAVYIDTGGSHFHAKEEEGRKPTNELVTQLIDSKKTLDEKMEDSKLTLFKGGPTISSNTFNELGGYQILKAELATNADERERRKAVFSDSSAGDEENESEEDDEEESDEEMGSEDEEGDEDGDSGDEDGEDSEEEMVEEEQSEEGSEGPSKKKTKIDMAQFSFADSEDDADDEDGALEAQLSPVTKRRSNAKTTMIAQPTVSVSDDVSDNDSDDVSDSDDYGADVTLEIDAKKIPVPTPDLGRNKHRDSVIKAKIREALESISKKSKDQKLEAMEEDNGDEKEMEEVEEDSAQSGYGDEEDSDMAKDDSNEIGHLKWKENLAARAQDLFYRHQSEAANLRNLVYGQVKEVADSDEEKDDEVGGMFRIAKKTNDQRQAQQATANSLDCSVFTVDCVQNWDLEEVMNQIRDCFVTGKWDPSEDANTLLKQDDELYGDFEDLETGEKYKGKTEDGNRLSSDDNSEDEKEEDKEGEDKPGIYETRDEQHQRKKQEKRLEKKRRLKEMFDREYDDQDGEKDGQGTYYDALKSEMEDQAQLNRKEFESMDEETRSQYEGFRPGLYVRIQVNHMPCEFIDNFDPTYPIILGALLSAEQNLGCVQVRLKKHRWHKKILKCRDPLILSLGWRRFQSMVIYSIQDHNMRNRMLKYTPEHLHCNATFWGPITPQGTGVLAVQTISGKTSTFRICATGVVLELDKSMTLVKKLKLTGTPQKIYKKTAFIEGMFNSSLEVSRFEGASIRTVSGIRGQIKKAAKTPEGAFRATFEDKILLSDIVFVRTWYPVAIPQLYNPVTTLLLPREEKEKWLGMKTVGQLKREAGIRRQVNEDHLYKEIIRKPKVFRPLRVPKDLQRALPFKDKPKVPRKMSDPVQSGRIAVIRDAKEKKVAELMTMLKALHENKMKQRRITMRNRAAQHQKAQGRIDDQRQAKQKEVKKQIYRVLGKKERRKERH